jgi:hypothetical protein
MQYNAHTCGRHACWHKHCRQWPSRSTLSPPSMTLLFCHLAAFHLQLPNWTAAAHADSML